MLIKTSARTLIISVKAINKKQATPLKLKLNNRFLILLRGDPNVQDQTNEPP